MPHPPSATTDELTIVLTPDHPPEFDLGPLSWVQGEIDQALTRGLDCLATYKASPRDMTALKQARAHVHQAAGAIQMVGLDAVTAYTDELERQLSSVEDTAPAANSRFSSTRSSAARVLFRSSSFPNTSSCSRRVASRRRHPRISSIPT